MITFDFNLQTFEYFLLILVRLTAFVYVAPFFGMPNTPRKVKVGFSFMVSILLYQIISPKTELPYVGVLSYGVMVVMETITGLLIGFAANICNSIILLTGKLIDMEIGLSMSTEYDPMTRTEVSVVANMYNYFIMLLLIVTYMHHYIFQALVDSFTVIPLGEPRLQWDHLMESMLQYMGDCFVIAFRIFLPVFAVVLILNCILGILAKVSPQMNMFAIGIELKLLVGFFVMFVTIFLLPDIANFIFKEMKTMIVLFMQGMSG
ncbi:MAG: flagellar biosynthetic protein FliR [Lachnospiraceae bacterium]